MNAYDITARDLAGALQCKPRAKQTVRKCTSIYGRDIQARHVVLVTPDGGTPEYYEVSDRGLENLIGGSTPEYLGLEPMPEPEPEHWDDRAFSDRAAEDSRKFIEEQRR